MPKLHTTKMDKEEHTTANNNSDQVSDKKFEGALGPLVQQIKLLRESFDDKYSHLDDKYTKLETVITSQKNEVLTELSKLQDSIINQKKELTVTVEQKMETAYKKLEQVLKENISLKKTNVGLQDRLAKIETTQLDNNVMLTGIQEQQWEKFEITKQRVIDIIADALKSSEGDNALSRAQQVDIATCK